MDYLSLILIPAMLTFFLSFLLTPLGIILAWTFGIIDDPKKNKHPKVIHTYKTPRGAGFTLFIAITIVSMVFLPQDKHLVGILSGAAILVFFGVLDDKFNLNPYLRLAIQFLAVLVPIAAGVGIAFVTNPLGGIVNLSEPRIFLEILGKQRSILLLADIFAIFWIVSITNFVNMGAKGVDGQLSGTVAIAAIVIALLSFQFSADITEWPVVILASIVSGAYLGFLPWHIHPQKIMPGFSGSNLAGYMLAILAILTTTKVGTLMVALAIPLIDTGYTIIRRIVSGKSPVWGDRGHLHHRLLDLGFSKSQVAAIYWGSTAILGIAALYLNSASKLYTIVGVAIFLGNLLLWITYRLKSSD